MKFLFYCNHDCNYLAKLSLFDIVVKNESQPDIDVLIQQMDELHIILKEYRADNDEICKNLDRVIKDTKILQKENNLLKKQNSQLEKEISSFRKECIHVDLFRKGDRIKILKPSIPASLERKHIIETDAIGKVDYLRGVWVFVTTDSGFTCRRFPSGLIIISPCVHNTS